VRPLSPYKGLAAFDDSDLDGLLFFGRERETEIIAANLQAARLTVLYGPSGVGKSSVLRAGVARRLREESETIVELIDAWTGDPAESLRARRDGVDTYLILDQFEEYFVYHSGEETLARALGGLVGDGASRVNVLIGIRDDALANLDDFRRFVPKLLGNRLHLDLLDRREARDAIVRPLDRYNELAGEEVTIEPELAERILDEVVAGRVELGRAGRGGTGGRSADRIEAPYLQLVLQTVWEEERASGSDRLRAATLERLGGAARIVHEHLEHAMADLSDQEKQAAAAMYNFLVTPSGTKIAHRVGDLAGYASLPEQQASSVLAKLARERIVRASTDDRAATRYEIFHDVLADAVLAWRSRYEEQAALREAERRRRRALVVATLALAALLLVASIAIFALVERSNSRSQARRAHAEALAAGALTQLDSDPSKSLRLALAAAQLRQKPREEAVLRKALLADRLRGVVRTGGPITAVAYGANGKRLLIASRDGSVRDGESLLIRPGPPVTSAAISPNGRTVAVGRSGGSLTVVGRGATDLRTLRGNLRSVVFVAHGARFVTATNTALTLWRTRHVQPLTSIRLPNRHSLVKVAVSPNGRQVVAVLRFRRADVYALPSGRRLFELEHDGFIQDAAYSPDGRFILTGGYDGDVGGVRLWNARTGNLVREYKGALLHVDDVTFSRDGKLVGAASADGTARVWATETGTEMAIMIGHQNEVTSVDFNPDGTALVSGSSDGTARVWGASGGRAGRLLNVLAGHRAPLTAALYSPTGRVVVTGSADGTARIWDPGSEPELTPLRRPSHAIAAAVQSRDRTRAASSNGDVRAVGETDGTVRVVDAHTGRVLWARRRHAAAVKSVAFSPDGSLLASGSVDHDALVWDVKTGHMIQRLHGHFGPVVDAQFSPDGRWIVTAGPITAGLWLVGSNAAPIFLNASVTRPLSAATFAGRDGRTVVAGSLDGSVLRYRCDICGNVHELMYLAQRRLDAER
jgi:WD40 repeat protein